MVEGKMQQSSIKGGAIVIGALVSIGLSFLLNLFITSMGLSVMTTNARGFAALATGSYVGMLVGIIAVMYISGLTAGYLARNSSERNVGEVYGFSTWALALIATIFLTSHMGMFAAKVNESINAALPSVVSTVNDEAKKPAKETMRHAKSNNNGVNAEAFEKTSRGLGAISFATFILFFVGALASCVGGRVGMGNTTTRR